MLLNIKKHKMSNNDFMNVNIDGESADVFHDDVSDQLNEFPNHCNINDCKNQIIKNQQNLIEQVRSNFTKKINKCVNESELCIVLQFPSNLLNSSRTILILELIERFGPLTIQSGQGSDIKCEGNGISHVNDIPKNPKTIIINIMQL